jgi:hypothetical protein
MVTRSRFLCLFVIAAASARADKIPPEWLAGPTSYDPKSGCLMWDEASSVGREQAPYSACFSVEEIVHPLFPKELQEQLPAALPYPGCAEFDQSRCPPAAGLSPLPAGRPSDPFGALALALPGGVCSNGAGWSFEDGGLDGWTPTGVFAEQPVFGNNVSIDRIRPPGFDGTSLSGSPLRNIGGDYWEFSRDVNQHGGFWIGSSDRRPDWTVSPGGRVAEDGEGTLTSPQFVIDSKMLTFLIGGVSHTTQRVELLVKPDSESDALALEALYRGIGDVEHPAGSGVIPRRVGAYVVVRASSSLATGEYMRRRVVWNLTELRGRLAMVRIVDEKIDICRRYTVDPVSQKQLCAEWEPQHVNVDDFRCADLAPQGTTFLAGSTVGSVQRSVPLWGTTDSHTHPMSNLFMGGHFYWADPSDDLAHVYDCRDGLPPIYDSHGVVIRQPVTTPPERVECRMRADMVATLSGAALANCEARASSVPLFGWAVGHVGRLLCTLSLFTEAVTLTVMPLFEGRTYHGATLLASGGFTLFPWLADPLGRALGLPPGALSVAGVVESVDGNLDDGIHSGHGVGRLHQQYQYQMVLRAWQGGLRLIVADAMNGRLMQYALDGREDFDDWRALAAHVDGMRRLVSPGASPANPYPRGPLADIAEIALSPAQARDIISRNKLAIVLGSEVQELGKARFAGDTLEQQVEDLRAMGIRKITPIHGINNPIGGTAFFNDVYNTANYYDNLTRDELGAAADSHWQPWHPDVPFEVAAAVGPPFGGLLLGTWSVGQELVPDMPCAVDESSDSTACLPWNLQNHGWFRAAGAPAAGDWIGVGGIDFRVGFSSGSQLQSFSGTGLSGFAVANIMHPIKANNLGWLIGAGPGGAVSGTRCNLEGMPLPFSLPFPPAVERNYAANAAHMNAAGLLPGGERFIRRMMMDGMLVDLDHLSQRSRLDTFALSRSFGGEAFGAPDATHDYPMFNVHTALRGVDKHGPVPFELRQKLGYGTENDRTPAELQRIAASGGTISPVLGAVFTSPDISDLPQGVNFDCDFSSKSWAEKYLLMMKAMKGKGITPSTDMNGLLPGVAPRFGNGRACNLRMDPNPAHLADFRRDWTDVPVLGGGTAITQCRENSLRPTGRWYEQCPSTMMISHQLAEFSGVEYEDYATRHQLADVRWRPRDRPDLKVVVARAPSEHRDDRAPRAAETELVAFGAAHQLRPLKKWLNGDPANNSGWDYNLDGLAHIGLYPDFFQDVRNIGVTFEQLTPLFNAAEDFVQMWERSCDTANAWRAAHPGAPGAPGC